MGFSFGDIGSFFGDVYDSVEGAVTDGLRSTGLRGRKTGPGQGQGRMPGGPGDYEWDTESGLPMGFSDFPDAGRALEFQAYNTRLVAEKNARLRRDAMNYLRQGRTLTESFRPGGASSLMQGNYRAMASTALSSQIEETDMLPRFREQAGEDARRAAESAARQQRNFDLLVTAGTLAAGSLGADGGAPAGGGGSPVSFALNGGGGSGGGGAAGYDAGVAMGGVPPSSGANQSTLPGAAAGADVGTNRLPGAQAGANVGTAPGVAPAVVSPEGDVGTVGQGGQQNRGAGQDGQQKQQAYDLSGDIALVMHAEETGMQFDSFVDTITKGMLARKAGILAEVM